MLHARQVILSGLLALTTGQAGAIYIASCPKGGQLSSIADSLSDYPPAIAYCTLNYPRQAPTVRVGGAATTTTTVVATTTVGNGNGGTVTSTVFSGPGVSTSFLPFVTVTSSVTGTSTSTVFVSTTSFTATTTITTTTTLSRDAAVKRNPAPTAAPQPDAQPQRGPVRSSQSRVFSSLTEASPSPALRTACKCLQRTRTVTSTANGATATVSSTSTVFNGGATTVTTTVLDSSTTITVTPTTTSFEAITLTSTTTVTRAIDALATETATLTIPANGPDCLPNGDFTDRGIGGCSTNCFCDLRSSDSSGFCNNGLLPAGQESDGSCTTDADCANGSTCALDDSVLNPTGTCLDFTGCVSSYDASTGTFSGKGPVAGNMAFGTMRLGRTSGKSQ